MIYADFNATTPLGSPARSRMGQAMETWGNPSSTHRVGRQALELMENARAEVAALVGVDPKEVVFTSGGSEANTMALLGSQMQKPGMRLLTSKVEHSSVRDTVKWLQATGNLVEFVKLRPDGSLDLAAFTEQLAAFRPDLVSLMTANNETGILFPIPEIAEACQKLGIAFHTDAVQALGKLPAAYFNGATLISISAHKIHGPKGIGALIVKRGHQLVPTHYGGSQEIKRRGGTENMVGIAGFGGACAALSTDLSVDQVRGLRDQFESKLRGALDDLTIHGSEIDRLPNTSNIRFAGVAADVLLSALDLDGICVSAGSACSSGSISPSHVLLEMGLEPTAAKECIRFSWGTESTAADIDSVAAVVINHVLRIRARKRR